jgi:polygalacturonase
MKCSKSDKNKTEATLQNIVIANCIVYHAHGGFVIGSNTDGGAKNISVNNCNFVNTDVGLRFKSGKGKGGIVENIFIKNIFMKDIENEAILFDLLYEDKGAVKTKDTKIEDKLPYFKNIYMNNIFCDGAKQAFLINSIPERSVSEIELTDAVLIAGKGFEAFEAENIKLNNVIIKSKKSPTVSINNSNNILLNNISCSGSPDLFMKINGEKTSQILLSSTKTDCAKKSFEIGAEVGKDALIIK